MTETPQMYYVLAAGRSVPKFSLPDGYSGQIWHPFGLALRPPSMAPYPYAFWSVLSRLGAMSRRDFGVYQVQSRSGDLAHASCILPKYYRFPFMGARDLMIASTQTRPNHRGKGLAKAAIHAIVSAHGAPGVRFWYFAAADNPASLRVVEACGFAPAGTGYRSAPFGLRRLGRYVLDKPRGDFD